MRTIGEASLALVARRDRDRAALLRTIQRDNGPTSYIAKRLNPLSSLIPERVSEDELAAHAPWELAQAAQRAALCTACPREGGACDGDTGYYSEGLVPAWLREHGLMPQPCAKWQGYAKRRHLLRAGIPLDMVDETFETYLPTNDTQAQALMKVLQYAQHAAPSDRMLILGPTGVGKTHLACAAAATLSLRTRVFFAYVPDLVDTIRREEFQKSTATRDHVLDVDFLVLDDIGAERSTEYVRETIEKLLNGRLNGRRSVIFTANVTPEKLAETLGAPCARRVLYSTDTIIKIEGKPYAG